MRCDEIQNDALFEVLDALPGADPEGEALRAHVAGCPACAARLSALGRVREALRGRTCPEVDPAVDAAVMTLARSEAARRRGTGGTVTPGWWEPALVAAAAALVLGVGVRFVEVGGGPVPEGPAVPGWALAVDTGDGSPVAGGPALPLAPTPETGAARVSTPRGDANGDGAVDAADGLRICRAVVDPSLELPEAGDYNGDGRVDVVDAMLLLRAEVRR